MHAPRSLEGREAAARVLREKKEEGGGYGATTQIALACVVLLLVGAAGVLARDASAMGHAVRIVSGGRAGKTGAGGVADDDDEYRRLHRLGRRGDAGSSPATAAEDALLKEPTTSSRDDQTGRADTGAVIKFPGRDGSHATALVDLDVRPFANLANLGDVHNASVARDGALGYRGLGIDAFRSKRAKLQRDPHVFGGHWGKQATLLIANRREQAALAESLSTDLGAVRADFEALLDDATRARSDIGDYLNAHFPPPPHVPFPPMEASIGPAPPDFPPPNAPPPPVLAEDEIFNNPSDAITGIKRASLEHEQNLNLHQRLAERIQKIREMHEDGKSRLELLIKNQKSMLEARDTCSKLIITTFKRILTLLKQVQASLGDTDSLLLRVTEDPRVGNADEELQVLEDAKTAVPARAMSVIQGAMRRNEDRDSMLVALNATVRNQRERVDALKAWTDTMRQFTTRYKEADQKVGEESRAVKEAEGDLPKLEEAVQKYQPQLIGIEKEGPYIAELLHLAESMWAHHRAAKKLIRLEHKVEKTPYEHALKQKMDHDAMPKDDQLTRDQLDTIAIKLKPLKTTRSKLLGIEEVVDVVESYSMEPLKAALSEAKTLVSDVLLSFDELCGEPNQHNGRQVGEVRQVYMQTEEYLLDHGGTPLFVKPEGVTDWMAPKFKERHGSKRDRWELDNNFTLARPPPPPFRPPVVRAVDPDILAADRSVAIDDLPAAPPPAYRSSFDGNTTTTTEAEPV